ncbi:hypothetical protein AAULR_25966, partial [Lacticaseibacillus rhamnosus MTCC 5462]
RSRLMNRPLETNDKAVEFIEEWQPRQLAACAVAILSAHLGAHNLRKVEEGSRAKIGSCRGDRHDRFGSSVNQKLGQVTHYQIRA